MIDGSKLSFLFILICPLLSDRKVSFGVIKSELKEKDLAGKKKIVSNKKETLRDETEMNNLKCNFKQVHHLNVF